MSGHTFFSESLRSGLSRLVVGTPPANQSDRVFQPYFGFDCVPQPNRQPVESGASDEWWGGGYLRRGNRSGIPHNLLALRICERCVSGSRTIFYWIQSPRLSPSQGQCRAPHEMEPIHWRTALPSRGPGLLSFSRCFYKPGSVFSTRDRSSARTSPQLQLGESPTWIHPMATTDSRFRPRGRAGTVCLQRPARYPS